MDGASGKFGAVACVRKVKHPIHAACAVPDHAQQICLVGPAAVNFASQSGLEIPNAYFTTPARKSHWEAQMANMPKDLEMVGAVALDTHGALAAAGSTRGMTGHMKVGVEDPPVLGADIFANEDVAVVW